MATPIDSQNLINTWSSNTKLMLDNIIDAVTDFEKYCTRPICFVYVDVDYYSGTNDWLKSNGIGFKIRRVNKRDSNVFWSKVITM